MHKPHANKLLQTAKFINCQHQACLYANQSTRHEKVDKAYITTSKKTLLTVYTANNNMYNIHV